MAAAKTGRDKRSKKEVIIIAQIYKDKEKYKK